MAARSLRFFLSSLHTTNTLSKYQMTKYQISDQLCNNKNQEVREPTATQRKRGFIC